MVHALRMCFLVLALAAGAVLAPAPGTAADAFLSLLDDVPLMTGLAEAEEGRFVFDAPAGRIVEVYAAGPVSAESVRAFYTETLPQLGWTAEDAGRFRREGESLEIEITETAAGVLVRFAVAPKPSP